jgi:hypothetical protein
MTVITASDITLVLPQDSVFLFSVEDWLDMAGNGARNRPEIERFITQIYRSHALTGLNPDLLVALSATDTTIWRSRGWEKNLHPGGVPELDQYMKPVRYGSGALAAYALSVHLMGYAKGHDNALADWIHLDPGFLGIHVMGHAGTVKRLAGLGNGKWSTDPAYKLAVLGVIKRMLDVRAGTTSVS